MSNKLRVTTAPEEFDVPEDWDGAVRRGEGSMPVMMKARHWQPGDVVECLMCVNGRTTPVQFTVGKVELI